MPLPEDLQQLVEPDLLGVVGDEHDLRVTGAPAADLLVGRVRGRAAGVADGRAVDAGRLPEHALRAPEAAEGEYGGADAVGERLADGRAQNLVGRRDARDLVIAAGQRVGGIGNGQLGGESIKKTHLNHSRVRARNVTPAGARGMLGSVLSMSNASGFDAATLERFADLLV